MDNFDLKKYLAEGKLFEEESFKLYSPEDIITYVEENSYMDSISEPEGGTLSFSTRENGKVGDEEASEVDYQEAHRIGKETISKFPGTSFTIEEVDEFIHLDIKYQEEEEEEDENRIGYVIGYEGPGGREHQYKTGNGFDREEHKKELKRLSNRFIVKTTPEEVVDIANSLKIPNGRYYSEKKYIQDTTGENQDEEPWDSIPSGKWYVFKRKIY